MNAPAAVVSRFALPWLGQIGWPWIIAAAAVALSGTGVTGLYYGSLIEKGRNAKTIAAIQEAHIDALKVRTDQYLGAIARGDEIADRFEKRLGSIKIENKTFYTEVKKETEKQVYIDCRVPESGVELLQRRIQAANAAIRGQTPKEAK